MNRRKILWTALVLVLLALAGLWIAGPLPPQSGVYVQSVSANSAVISKVDRAARRLTVRIWAEGDEAHAMIVAEDEPVAVHAIRVDGLAPGTRYLYALQADDAPIDRGTFRTAPLGDEVAVRFAAVGDTGELPIWFNLHEQGFSRIRPLVAWMHQPEQWDVARWIDAQDLHFFVHLGDVVYWRKQRDAHEEAFFRPFAAMLRDTPLFTLAGNHDLNRDGSTPPFEEFFRNPAPANVGAPQRNFEFAWGSVRVVALDVEDPNWEKPPVRDWLETALSRATEPWLVVVIHKPCFSVYRPEYPALSGRLWGLLTRFGVDLVLSGDDHHFARFKPTQRGGPIQVIAGGGGKSLYDFKADDPRLAASAKAWSFLVVEAKALRLEGRVLGSETKVLDEFVIDRSKGELSGRVSPARKARIMRLRK